MKKIIVPVDFSKHSEYALKTAVSLAKKNGAELLILHMLELQETVLSESVVAQQEKAVFLLKLAEKRFKQFLNKEYLKEVKVTPVIKHFKVFSEINEIAKEENADLIVMGSHGVSGAKEFFIGSNTEKVIRFANLPVLVIKNELNDTTFKEILFACDFSKETIASYKKAIKTLESLGENIRLVYVNTPTENFKSSTEMEKIVADFLQEAEGNLNRLKDVNYVCEYSIEKGILNFANIIGADLIATITHGRKGLTHFFKGSIAEDVANHATLPVITFKIL